ncbi:MAG TPA: sialidase family protein [Candidatus Dormibacteraeota bacterium]
MTAVRGRGLPLLGGAALLTLAAIVFLVVMLVARGPAPQLTSNTLLGGSGPNAIVQANDSPTVVRNPTNTQNIVVTNRIDRPGYSAGVHWSSDAGRTWHSSALPLPPGRDRPYAPDPAFAPDGTLYVVYVNLEGTGNDPQELWIARSADGGATFQGPFPITGRYAFQARLAIDAGGTIYVTYLHATQVGLLTLIPPAGIQLQRSTDRGETFSTPVAVSDADRVRVGVPTPVIDSSGNVDVLYEDFKGDARDFLNLPGPAWESPFALVLSRSTNHGASFSQGQEIDSDLLPSGRFLVYLPQVPSIAAGPDDTLYVSWADGRSGTDRVYLRRSTDGGQAWQALVNVTNGITDKTVSAWLPAVGVAPDGRVDLLYYQGHRDTGDNLIRADIATSGNGGASFTSVAASATAFNSSIGPQTGPTYLPPDLGSKLSLESANSGVLAAWTDTRLGTTDTGRQDIGVGAVNIGAAPVAAWQWVVLAALLLAGEALVLLWVLQQRRARRGAESRRTSVPTTPG